MGSHGGATAGRRRAVLSSLGVTEATVAAPVRATMETMPVATAYGGPVLMDALAAQAGAIVLVNRVKPQRRRHRQRRLHHRRAGRQGRLGRDLDQRCNQRLSGQRPAAHRAADPGRRHPRGDRLPRTGRRGYGTG